MIASLNGNLIHKSIESLILDVSGVGYEIFVPLSTYYDLPDEGADTSLYTYLSVREDALTLYGFLTVDEKSVFIKLKSVSGIGPKLALAILSGMDVPDLIGAIENKDIQKLTTIPGVGKKTAERLALELKDKLTDIAAPAMGAEVSKRVTVSSSVHDDVLSALINLGYKKNVAEHALGLALKEAPEEKELEKILRITLSILSRS